MRQNHEPFGLADPANQVSEILPGLFQGGTLREQVIDREQLLVKYHEDPRPYDSVVTLYAWAAPVGYGIEERRFSFPDGELIRCAAGMNRSGFVTALVLLRAGYTANDAIALVQSRRSAHALSNASFVKYLQARCRVSDPPATVVIAQEERAKPCG